jgi:hypothetical protein
MKITRLVWLSLLSLALLQGLTQAAQGEDIFPVIVSQNGLLKNSSQVTELYLDNATGNWIQSMPDGTTKTYNWGGGKFFVMTGLFARFYADTTDTHPYRIYFKNPNGGNLWIDNLEALTYPTTGGTVWGGSQTESFSPGIVMAVKPTIVVQHLPAPPANPNSGPVVTGTTYIRITGYTVP